MHPIVSGNPEWQQFQKQRGNLQRAATKALAASDRATREHGEACRQHQQDALEAARQGEILDRPAPAAPRSVVDPAMLQAETLRLADQERAWLAAHSDSIEAQAAEEEARQLEAATALTDQLNVIGGELRSLAASIAATRRATSDKRPVDSTPFTAVGVAELVRDRRRPLQDPAPRPGFTYSSSRDTVATYGGE